MDCLGFKSKCVKDKLAFENLIEKDQDLDRWTAPGKENTPYQAERGQLKLAVYFNSGLLTIHIIQARHLASKWKTFADSYVKLALVPDEKKRTRCKTEIYTDCNQPIYDQKFSFELLKEDSRRRLLVSVWHKDLEKGRIEFLGGMSFGVRHLLSSKKINGWYYLLTEDVGRGKHLVVNEPKTDSLQKGKSIPQVNRDILWMDPFTVTVKRGRSGYGFTVVGCSPVRVGMVDVASAAEGAGLREGDYIVRINGQNVSRSTAESVVRIVKQSTKQLVLDIQRTRRCGLPTQESSSSRRILGEVQACSVSQTILPGVPQGCFEDEGEEGSATAEWDAYLPGIQMPLTECMPRLTLTFQDLTTSEQQKQTVVQKLVQCEQHFLDIVQAGIQSYLQPLKSSFLTQQQHQAIFQNLEKLLRLSEHHLSQLQEYSVPYSDNDRRHEVFIDTIGGVYESKVGELCREYDTYRRGIKVAEQQLLLLKSNKQFSRFVQETSHNAQLDLGTVLYKPLEHIQELCTLLQGVLVNTPHHHHDYDDLSRSVEDLQDLCGKMIISYTNWSTSLPRSVSATCRRGSLSSSRSSSQSRSTSNSMSLLPRTSTKLSMFPRQVSKSSTLPRSLSSRSSSLPKENITTNMVVDPEILAIQSKLTFAKNIQKIQLASEVRHLIYSAELLQNEKGRWTKHVGLLFSDILLVAKPEGDTLHVTEDPIILKDIKSSDFSLEHPLEFFIQVTAEPVIWTGHDHTILTQTYRAPTTEKKLTWKNILEQRMNALIHRPGDDLLEEVPVGTLAIL